MSDPSFHVVHVQPRGFIHAAALTEIAEYLRAQLAALGYRLGAEEGAIPIVVGGHLLPADQLAALPAEAILFNSEPLADPVAVPVAFRAALGRHRVWDYSPLHRAQVPHARVVPFGYCAALVRTQRVRSPGEAIVFHGMQTRRRRRVIAQLAGERVAIRPVVGEYGVARDVRMMRARAILNLHKSDGPTPFEAVRCFYPLIQGVPVISEETGDPAAEPFRDVMTFVAEAHFARDVAARLRDPAFDEDARARAARFAERSVLPALREVVEATLSARGAA